MAPERFYDEANIKSSFILDYSNSGIQFAVTRLNDEYPAWMDFLRAAQDYIKTNVKPAFSLDNYLPVSVVLERRKGSTNQKLALMEAFARAKGIPTRVRGIWLKRDLWQYHLEGAARTLVPEKVLVAWPQFWLNEGWVDFDELFGTAEQWRMAPASPFNLQSSSLFDAVGVTFVDLTGKSGKTSYNLSQWVVGQEQCYDTRDELFAKLSPPRNRWLDKASDWLAGDNTYL